MGRSPATEALAAVLWGLAPVAIKRALRGYSPEFISVFRLTVAALVFRLFAGSGAQFFVSDVSVGVMTLTSSGARLMLRPLPTFIRLTDRAATTRVYPDSKEDV